MSPTSVVAYLVLFAAVGFLFLVVTLLLGRLLRPNVPTAAKLETYECGEPPVGSSFVQFDLRFYVVALLFIIFEVEVALFFPPATIFGKATQLMRPQTAEEAQRRSVDLGIVSKDNRPEAFGTANMYDFSDKDLPGDARLLSLAAMADLGAFFAVILLGFAYVWYRGDLNWVRVIGSPPLRLH